MRYALIKPTIIATRRRIIFNEDIRDITLSHQEGVSDEAAAEYIRQHIPEHDVFTGRFPLSAIFAGWRIEKELARAGARFCLRYPVARCSLMWCALSTRVVRRCLCSKTSKNLKSHDPGGKTFRIIMQTLDELGYDVADAEDNGPDDPKIIDGKHFLPQHRERIVLVGFRRDLNLKADFYSA